MTTGQVWRCDRCSNLSSINTLPAAYPAVNYRPPDGWSVVIMNPSILEETEGRHLCPTCTELLVEEFLTKK